MITDYIQFGLTFIFLAILFIIVIIILSHIIIKYEDKELGNTRYNKLNNKIDKIENKIDELIRELKGE